MLYLALDKERAIAILFHLVDFKFQMVALVIVHILLTIPNPYVIFFHPQHHNLYKFIFFVHVPEVEDVIFVLCYLGVVGCKRLFELDFELFLVVSLNEKEVYLVFYLRCNYILVVDVE